MSDIISKFKAAAREAGNTVVLPESNEERTLRATQQIISDGIARVILLGDAAEIESSAKAASALPCTRWTARTKWPSSQPQAGPWW